MKRHLLFLNPILIFCFWASALNIKGASNALIFILFLCSAFFWRAIQNNSLRHWALLFALPFLFALTQKFLGFNFKINALDAPSRFLLASACIFMFYQCNAQHLSKSIAGAIIGALGVGIWAYLSTHIPSFFWIDGQRAWNGFSNPIPFGLLSLLLGFLAINVPHAFFPKVPVKLFVFIKLLALYAAFYAAYLSLSRIALLVLPFLAIVLILQHAQHSKKIYWHIFLSGVVLSTILFFTDNPYQTRVESSFSEITEFEKNPNTSMGLRLSMWQDAIELIQQHPWGMGKNGFINEMRRRHPFKPKPAPHPHNEYLNFGVEFGIPGIVLAFLIYFVPLIFFYQHLKKQPNLIIQNAAANGLMVTLSFSIGGLLDCYFWITNQCVFYGLSVMLFVAIILKEKNNVHL